MAIRWSPLLSMTAPRGVEPTTVSLSLSSVTLTPILSSPSLTAATRSDSLSRALPMPLNSLTPSATAPRAAIVGNRSMHWDKSARIAFSLAFLTVTELPPTSTTAPIFFKKSSIILSPCKLSGFRLPTVTSPPTAPSARKYEAEDQSPSTSYRAGLYLCPATSNPPATEETCIPNFFRQSMVINT